MGGRGRGGGGAGATVRAVANALGIARHEMNALTHSVRSSDPPPIYPEMKRPPMPLEVSSEQRYISNLHVEMIIAFRESECYLEREKKKDVTRYNDRRIERERLQPDFSLLPDELCFAKTKEPKSKKRKTDVTGEVIDAKLARLEKAEKDGGAEGKETVEDEEDGSEHSQPLEAEALSDEDYAEEDNDYIQGYFDNGEGYGDAGSDENMDGDEF